VGGTRLPGLRHSRPEKEWAARGLCAECQSERALTRSHPAPMARPVRKSRGFAVFSALILGGPGAHKFCLGRPGKGLLYFMFFWTLIPAIVALFEGASYALMGEEEFQRRYSW